jgi:hypothetical protein
LDDNLHEHRKLGGVRLDNHMNGGEAHSCDVPLGDHMMFYDVDTF